MLFFFLANHIEYLLYSRWINTKSSGDSERLRIPMCHAPAWPPYCADITGQVRATKQVPKPLLVFICHIVTSSQANKPHCGLLLSSLMHVSTPHYIFIQMRDSNSESKLHWQAYYVCAVTSPNLRAYRILSLHGKHTIGTYKRYLSRPRQYTRVMVTSYSVCDVSTTTKTTLLKVYKAHQSSILHGNGASPPNGVGTPNAWSAFCMGLLSVGIGLGIERLVCLNIADHTRTLVCKACKCQSVHSKF